MITEFQGEAKFLSNMYDLDTPIEINREGEVLPVVGDGGTVFLAETAEQAYQAAKFRGPELRELVVGIADGVRAKRVARFVLKEGPGLLVPDWEEKKVEVMKLIVGAKFSNNPDLAERLVATGTQVIQEGNTWGDEFWGVCPPVEGKGRNMLGVLLMDLRLQLASESG